VVSGWAAAGKLKRMSAAHVVIVGGGHNGLVCACRLAEHGLRVTVLEQADDPGGGVRSGEYVQPRFVHDHCAGFMPVAMASPAMQAMQLERYGVDWIAPESILAHPFPDGSAIELNADVGATARSLDSVAPGTGAAWERMMRRLLPVAGELAGSIFARFPPLAPPLRLLAHLRRDAIELARRSVGSAEAFGDDLFAEERATAWFCGAAMHSGLEPRAASSGAFSLLLMLLGHHVRWPFPRGGAGAITQALVRRLESFGGEVRCGAGVAEIGVRGARVTGVTLEDGETLPADAVVATLSAGALAPLLPPGALPGRLERRLRKWRYGTGAFKLDFALSGPAPWTAEAARRSSVVHVAGELADLSRAAQQGNRGVPPERPALVVGQHTLYDSSRAPAGSHTLYSYAHVPHGRDIPDGEMADRMQAQLERFAPGFSKRVIARGMRPPEQLARENRSLVGGDLASGSFELDQQLVFRPAPEMVRYRTPLRGLYLGSASVHPGAATHGVCGYGAARSLLEDLSPLRPWRRLPRPALAVNRRSMFGQ
jgi:phytoene dehydrogenase-like protein